MLEGPLAITDFRLQGRNEKCVKTYMKYFADAPGLFNVGSSRVRSPKDNHIPSGKLPNVLDVNIQRLYLFLPEVEIFNRVVKIMSLKTVAKHSIETGVSYGHKWSKEEYNILEDVVISIRSQSAIDSTSIKGFLFTKSGKKYCLKDVESNLSKIDGMRGIGM